MVYELERVLRVCNGFLCSMPVTYDGAVLLWQHKQAMLYVLHTLTGSQLSDLKCMVILDDFESVRLLELHSSVSVASGMSHRE